MFLPTLSSAAPDPSRVTQVASGGEKLNILPLPLSLFLFLSLSLSLSPYLQQSLGLPQCFKAALHLLEFVVLHEYTILTVLLLQLVTESLQLLVVFLHHDLLRHSQICLGTILGERGRQGGREMREREREREMRERQGGREMRGRPGERKG
jgi:hypothetical protein